MSSIMDIINIPIGWVLKFLSNLTGGNFALAIVMLTVFANLIMIPLSLRSQRSSAKQARLRPRLDALKQKCGDDKMKYNEEMQKLYTEEGVSMTGGCLPMLLRLPFFIGVYYVVRSPLTYVMGISADIITTAKEAIVEVLNAAGKNLTLESVSELDILGNLGNSAVREKLGADIVDTIAQAQSNVDFKLFGIDLTSTPNFSWNVFGDFELIWLIPILSFATAMISSLFSTAMQKKNNPDTPNMGCIMFSMPLISLVIAFGVPGAVGFYWACSNVVSGIIQIFLQKYCGPNRIIAKDQIKETLKRHELEQKKMNRAAE